MDIVPFSYDFFKIVSNIELKNWNKTQISEDLELWSGAIINESDKEVLATLLRVQDLPIFFKLTSEIESKKHPTGNALKKLKIVSFNAQNDLPIKSFNFVFDSYLNSESLVPKENTTIGEIIPT